MPHMNNSIDLKFIFVDRDSARELVEDRNFQSSDFQDGKKVVDVILKGEPVDFSAKKFSCVIVKQGAFFLSKLEECHNFLVIDLQESRLFQSIDRKDILYVFQKALRFSIKRWEKMSLTSSEKYIPSSTKGVVFPFPFSTKDSFRMVFEFSPDHRRREKRAKGEEILLYKSGTEEGDGPSEEASTTIFKKAVESLHDAKSLLKQRPQESLETNGVTPALSVTRLEGAASQSVGWGVSFENWIDLLTNTQKDFVQSDLVSPHRIEGPAGTGKTLCLVLKCISTLRKAKEEGRAHNSLFIAHSEATKKHISQIFQVEVDSGGISMDRSASPQSVKISTLSTYCAEILNTEISESEFLDRDAFESKQAQLLYTLEALDEALELELKTHKEFMSEEFVNFVENEEKWVVAEIMQHEISVKIKGRAEEDQEKYRRLPRLKYGLPVVKDGDKIFTFIVFKNYQKRLEKSGQFDTDDIVLSALGQLQTPIWRRRRSREGFDSIFIDETHLFNVNELSVFHKLTKNDAVFPIAYTADVSQSLGDRGWDDESFDSAMRINEDSAGKNPTVFRSIFRCSPSIVNLAFSVTSSGATLFTNFQDPIAAANSAFTYNEEKKCKEPIYLLTSSDDQAYKLAFQRAEGIFSSIGGSKADIAIIAFGDAIFSEIEKFARALNKPVEVIKHRGDFDVVRRARQNGKFVLSAPEYVGGLEFSAVVLVGVDRDRVPPKPSQALQDSHNYLSYASHQRLYVAITRARFQVEIIGLKSRGPSTLLVSAIEAKLITVIDQV